MLSNPFTNDARPAQKADAYRPCPLERQSGGIAGCSTGINIVHQDDVAIPQTRSRFGTDFECTSKRLRARFCPKPRQDRSGFDTDQYIILDQIAFYLAKVARDRRRLIKTASPYPPAVQRYGNEYRIGLVNMACHRIGHQSRKADSATVLEPNRNIAGNAAVDRRRANSVVTRRIGQTRSANLPCDGDRRSAAPTALSRQKLDPVPTDRTKSRNVFDYRATPRASRRQREINDLAKRLGENVHKHLVPGKATMHKHFDD